MPFPDKDVQVSGFRNEQRRILHRGRMFHFVSYEAQDAKPPRQLQAMPDTWYLVSSGNRWPAIPVMPERSDAQLEHELTAWLESTVFGDPSTESAPESQYDASRGA